MVVGVSLGSSVVFASSLGLLDVRRSARAGTCWVQGRLAVLCRWRWMPMRSGDVVPRGPSLHGGSVLGE